MSLIPLIAIVAAVALFLFGLYAALQRVETTLDRREVTIRRRRCFTTKTEALALSDYPGVLCKRVTYSRNKKSYVAWLAARSHDDKRKRVVLGASRDEA